MRIYSQSSKRGTICRDCRGDMELGRARRGKAMQGKERGLARHGEARRGGERGNARHGRAWQGKDLLTKEPKKWKCLPSKTDIKSSG